MNATGWATAVRSACRNFKKLVRARSFVPLADLPAYRRLLAGDDSPLVGLRMRALGGGAVYARPGTEDSGTLASVFRDRYHLPPATLPAAPVILDLGCNCGYTIAHYKHLYPDARVIGVELDADNVAVALRNTERLADVHVVHAAVACRDGVVSYDRRAREDAYRIELAGSAAPAGLQAVQAISIPSLLGRFGLEAVDFAKIDIEGEEVRLFDEAEGLGWLDAVRSLNVEVHAPQPVLEAMLATLDKHGFRAWRDTRHWSAIMAVRRSGRCGGRPR